MFQSDLIEMTTKTAKEITEFDENLNGLSSVLAMYMVEQLGADKIPVYCPELGLAVEKLKNDVTLKSVWDVLTSDDQANWS